LEVSDSVVQNINRGASLLVVVHGEDGVSNLRDYCDSMSAQFRCSILTPSTTQQVHIMLQDVLSLGIHTPTATLDNCACCVIKPHAVKNRAVGKIINQILEEGFDISAITTVMFDRATAEEFLEVYQGVVPDYTDHIVQFCSGLSVVLEVKSSRSDDYDVVGSFRQVCGPWDVEIARELRPESIRAKHGYNNVYSAVHCTDLETDGANECEYCFHILNSALLFAASSE